MAKLPSSILKQLTARAKERTTKLKSMDNPDDVKALENTPLIKAHIKTGNYYLFYDDVIRSFLISGYSENVAEKYINTWKEYDLVDVWYLDRNKIIGFDAEELEKAII